jgi:hypothetical protein
MMEAFCRNDLRVWSGILAENIELHLGPGTYYVILGRHINPTTESYQNVSAADRLYDECLQDLNEREKRHAADKKLQDTTEEDDA